MQKDLHLPPSSAYEAGAAMPLTNAVKELYRLAIRDGRGSQDFSAIYDYLAHSHEFHPMDKKPGYKFSNSTPQPNAKPPYVWELFACYSRPGRGTLDRSSPTRRLMD